MVTLKFNLKNDEGEQESEAPAVVVEPDGLVLVSNRAVGGFAPFAPNVNPTELKVLIGEDTQGEEATLVARDTELGLAWVKIKSPKGKYPAVDLAQSSTPALGDGLYVISLLSRFFDRAPAVTVGSVSAVAAKPRRLFVPSLSLAGTDFGIPVFAADGKVVGIVTLILPDQDELSSPGAAQELFRNVPGGKVILPASDVLSATKRAKETQAGDEATPSESTKQSTDAAKPKGDAPAEPKPATPK